MRLTSSLSLLLVLVASATVPARSQSALSSRLIQQSDLVYQGSFTFANTPSTCWAGTMDWAFVQGVVSFNPTNQSLFMVGHGVCQQVAEFKIPAMGGVASVLQGSRDVTDGKLGDINTADPNSKAIGGLLVIGDKLVATGYSTYDGGGTASSSHFVRSTNLTNGSTTGPFRVGTLNPAFYAGYMAPVPSEWQASLGGDVLSGQCCLSIISRTSFGPSVSAVKSADLLAAKNPSVATMLVGYPAGHTTLGDGTTQGPLFNVTTQVRGVVLPESTATVLFFGRHGLGTYCYGEVPTECNDPEISYKGGHAYPYEPHVWAYNANDLAAVKTGSKQPWDVKPYATWRLPSQVKSSEIGGVAVDPASGRIFVIENHGDGDRPRAHVFTISGATTSGDSTMPVVSVTTPVANSTVAGTIALTASASDNVGVASVWFTLDGTAVGGEDTSSPYQGTFDTNASTNGAHVVRAIARDAAGNVASSVAVNLTVNNPSTPATPTGDTKAPTVALASPASGATVSGTLTVTATAADNVGVTGVQFMLDGTDVGTIDTAAPYQLKWATSGAANGNHTLQAVARDAAGNATTSSAITVKVSNTASPPPPAQADTTAPQVTITSPAALGSLKGNVVLKATASDNVGVASVEFLVDRTVIGAASRTSAYQLTWSTSAGDNGFHVVTAVARDAAGNRGTSKSVYVWISNPRQR